MARKAKVRGHLKRRGAAATAMSPGAVGLAPLADGPPGDESWADGPTELPDVGRAEIERVDEHSSEPIDSLTEPAADDGGTSAIEAATADPAEALAPPHLVER